LYEKKDIIADDFVYGFSCFCTGNPETKTTPAPATIINVESLPHYEELKKRINLTGAVMTADKEPEFPGGMALFRRKFAENMEVIYAKGKKIDTRVYFIVEKTATSIISLL
jgi:hypothetical protein